MKFENSLKYYDLFEKIQDIRFHPYVGKNFDIQEKRIMIFAHNIYCASEKFKSEQIRTKSKTHFADALDEYTYSKGWWTKAWRNFIKASVGLKSNYSIKSNTETILKIDSFVNSISYTNYINDLIKSDKATNILVPRELINQSNRINAELLKILNITHCVCWGKPVYNHLKRISDFERVGIKKLDKKGFEYMELINKETMKKMHVLKIFHPSMPGFGHYNPTTHSILKKFYSL